MTPDSYVFDFVTVKEIARRICEPLDHRFLLPMNNPHLKLHQENDHWEIGYQERRYVFPARDVCPLPVDNITAERLSEYIWKEVANELRTHGGGQLINLTVGVEEAPGQAAFCSQVLSESLA